MKTNSKATVHPKFGDIYIIDFQGSGHVQRGRRPGIIFQNNKGNMYSPNVIAIPITSVIKKEHMVTHVFLSKDVGLKVDSIALCENPACVPKESLIKYVSTLPDKYLREIAIANLLATSAISFVDPEALLSVWRQAVELNTA